MQEREVIDMSVDSNHNNHGGNRTKKKNEKCGMTRVTFSILDPKEVKYLPIIVTLRDPRRN